MKRVISTVFLILLLVLSPVRLVFALDTSRDNFLNGSYLSNLINDSSFIDINSMSQDDIQKFLESKNSNLKDFKEGDKSAAQIIYEASHGGFAAAVGDWKGISVNSTTGTVSPRIILTFLEKEQSLISKTEADQDSLDCAMGYEYGQGCQNMFQNYPSLKGFSNQIGNGAWQLRYDYEYAIRGTKPADAATHYIVGEKVSLSDQDFTTSYDVTMTNASTASIYSYTPYVFDSAYNFWKIFNNWFTPSEDKPVVTTDDTARYTEKTFSESITIGGSKTTDSKVYFNNQLIQDSGTRWQITFNTEIGTKDYTVEYRNTAGTVIGTKQISIERHKTGDVNGDGKIDLLDLSAMAQYWGQNKPADALADMNGDGIVDILDLSGLASNWSE